MNWTAMNVKRQITKAKQSKERMRSQEKHLLQEVGVLIDSCSIVSKILSTSENENCKSENFFQSLETRTCFYGVCSRGGRVLKHAPLTWN